jgi:uncharacterized protein (TIGR03437 family)
MIRASLALAVLVCGVARAAAPHYTADWIVNASNYAPGPFAPNSILSIFGTELSRSERALIAEDIRDNSLPTELNFTRVRVDGVPVPLFYVSKGQINFLVPAKQLPGDMRVQVVRQGLAGPIVIVPIVEAAPALFTQPNGYAIATHADDSLIMPESPARGGETIVIWATGLGKTVKNPATGELPPYVSEIVHRDALQISVGGTIRYAGLTPGSAGLYQINLELPENIGNDPDLWVSVGDIASPAGLKLAAR